VDLRQVRYFLEVARHLHFCRAARKLKISQPTLSQQIKALEKQVGAELFVRKPKGIILSPAGAAFLNKARLAVSDADAAIQDALDAKNGITGHLKILCGPLAEFALLKDVLRLMCHTCPSLAMDAHFSAHANHFESISDGTFSVSFMSCHSPSPDSGLLCETVYKEDCVVMLPESHVLAKARILTLQQLAQETWITTDFSESLVHGGQLWAACREAGFAPKLLETTDSRSLFPLVESGAGIGLVPASLQSIRRPELRFVPLAADLQIPVNLITRADDVSPHLLQFREHAAHVAAMQFATALPKAGAAPAARRIVPRHYAPPKEISHRLGIHLSSKPRQVSKAHRRERATLAPRRAI
jgi:DNA-binding transcriptional LysR family regulator